MARLVRTLTAAAIAWWSLISVTGSLSAEGPLEIVSLSTSDFPHVRLYLSATDRAANPVTLAANDLTVTDSDQRIDAGAMQVASAERAPVALALLLDQRDQDWIDPIGALTGFEFLKRSSSQFLDSFPQGHQVQVVSYDKIRDANLGLDATPAAPKARLQAMTRHPKSWLYDRIDFSLDLLRKADRIDRKVLVVVADGNDVDSDMTGQADYIGTLATKARNLGVSIFVIGSGREVRDRLIGPLAERTGGLFQLSSTQQLDRAFQRIVDAVRLQTVVTYLAPCTGRPHTVTVAATSLGAQATRQFEAGEAAPQLRITGRKLSENEHEVAVEVPPTRCALRPPGVWLDLGVGGTLEAASQVGDRYVFNLNPRERNLPSGKYLARGVANNGLEGRSSEAYEFDWACSPPWSCGGTSLPALGLVVALFSVAGAGLLVRELRRPRPVDAYLQPYYERGGTPIWPEGTQFYLRSTTTIGRTGGADVAIPNQFKNIPGQAVRLAAKGKGDELHFDVSVEAPNLHVWIDRKPVSKDHHALREGGVLAIEGLSFRLMRREATQSWISDTSTAP